MGKKVLELKNVSKSFGKRKIIDNLNLEVEEGEIYGFLGPNGSGKTTTIKMILRLINSDSGEIKVNGYDTKKQFEKAMECIGAIVENPDLYKYMSGIDNLRLHARIRNIDEKRIKEVLELVELKGREKDKVGKYSLGMKQRLGLALTLLHKPKVLILDEPTNGLDPAGIKKLRDILKEISHKDILLIADASQTAGILPIDVQKMGIDVLCFTGHKGLMGPQGTGGLYVRQGVKINPLKVGGSGIHSFDHDHPKAMPEHLEAGTLNVHGIAGLGGALNYLSEIGTEAIIKTERSLIKRLEDQIRDLPNIHLYGNPDSSQRVGILSFNMGDEDSAYVADWLFEEEEIAVRSGAHCAPLMHETLGTKMQGAVRISVSHKNTEEEIDRTAKAIKKLSQLLE